MHEPVWRELSEAASRSRAGEAQRVAIRGSLGIGKSALLTRLKEHLIQSGFTVLSATGFPEESHTPYAALNQLLWKMRDRINGSDEYADLERCVLGLDSPTNDASVALALLRLLSRLAEDGPVCVAIDDYQWVDPSSGEALLFAARRLEADAVLVVIAYRPDDIATPPGGLQQLDLSPLTDDAARLLLRQWHPQLCAPVTEVIVATAGGVPLVLREAPAALSLEQQRGTQPLPEILPVGAGMSEHYAGRLSALEPTTRLALIAAALEHLSPTQLAQTLSTLHLSIASLDGAVTTGLVRYESGGLEWRHPTVRAAVLDQATPSDLARARTALIAVLADEPAAVARLRDGLATGPDVDAADALTIAAHDARDRSAWEEAGHFFARAAQRSADPDQRRGLLQEAAAALGQQEPDPTLMRVLRTLADESRTPVERARWEGALLVAEGGPFSPTPPEDLKDLAHQIGGTDGCALLRRLAHHHLMAIEFAAAREAVGLAHELRVSDVHLADRVGLDAVACVAGGPSYGTMHDRSWLTALTAADYIDPEFPMTFALTVVGWLGHVDEAMEASRSRVAALESAGMMGPLSIAVAHDGVLHEAQGDLIQARAAYERGMSLADAADLSLIRFYVIACRAALAARMGEIDTAQHLLDSLPPEGLALPSPLAHMVLLARANLALSATDLSAAADLLESARHMEKVMGIVLPRFSPRVDDQICVLALLDRHDELAAISTEQQARCADLPVGLPTAVELAASALLSPDTGVLWQRAFARAQADRNPLALARVHLLKGHQLRSAGQKAEAVDELRAARRQLQQLSETGLLAQTQRQLSACGERRVEDAPPGSLWAQFTPREYDVVRLIVDGASNAEAAEHLVLSRRTVEFHIANAMRKAGVRSRTDLAAAVGARSAQRLR